MFSPEGFVSFSSLWRRLPTQTQETAWSRAQKLYESLSDPQYLKRVPSPLDMIESQMFKAIADNAWLCSPDGKLMRIDVAVWLDAEEFSKPYPWPSHARGGTIPRGFWEAFKLAQYDDADFDAAVASGKSVIEVAEETEILHWHTSIPLFHERLGSTICLDGFRWGLENGLIDSHRIAPVGKMLGHFEGWALCVSAGFEETEFSDKILAAATTMQASRARPGRPRDKIDAAVKTISTLGDRSMGMTQKQIAAEVMSQTGLIVDVTTVARAQKMLA